MHGRKEHYRVYRHDSSKWNALIYNVYEVAILTLENL